MKNRHFITTLLMLWCCATASAETIVIQGAKIHSFGALGTMPVASIVIVDGEISEIGKNVGIPDGAIIINGTGKVITPGVFDTASSLGLAEVSAVDATVDNEQSLGYGPAFRVVEGFNPRSVAITTNRIEGVTRALIVPQADRKGHVLTGTASVVNFGSNTAFVERERAAVVAMLGEAGAQMSGGARAAAHLRLREALIDAQDYYDNRSDYDEGATRKYSLGKSDLEALQGVLVREIPLLVSASRASDIQAAVTLSKEFNIKLVIIGGAEAWMIAGVLAAAQVPVILDPMQNLPDQFESLNSSLKNAVMLDAAGVTIAFAYEDSFNSRNLTQVAGNAVANGLSWDTALRAITVNPAKIFGLECCSLEPGNAADLVVWDGDPLEVTTFADHVFIKGRKIPMKSRQTLLRDRYLNLDDKKPFAYRK